MIANKYKLGFFPTPLHKLTKLSEQFQDFNIFIKRDDQTGLASGGNKTRKLEYLIKQALDNNCDTVFTAGAQQSNHCRQTAAACSVAGLECHLIVRGKEPQIYQGNLLLSHLLGANIHFTGNSKKEIDFKSFTKKLEHEKKPFIIMSSA
jgi:L-cysteate sulfo-lyase